MPDLSVVSVEKRSFSLSVPLFAHLQDCHLIRKRAAKDPWYPGAGSASKKLQHCSIIMFRATNWLKLVISTGWWKKQIKKWPLMLVVWPKEGVKKTPLLFNQQTIQGRIKCYFAVQQWLIFSSFVLSTSQLKWHICLTVLAVRLGQDASEALTLDSWLAILQNKGFRLRFGVWNCHL